MHLDVGCEHVAVATHRDDHRRRLRIGLDLAANSAHLHVDGPIERGGVAAAGEIEELVAVHDALRVLGKGDEQLVLAGGEVDDDAVRRFQPAAAEVELPSRETEQLGGRNDASRHGRRADTAQDGAYPGEQFARAEGLGEVVVGAHLEADDAVGLVAHGGQHQYGNRRTGAQLAADFQAAFAGEHEVENQEVDLAGGQHLLHGNGIARGRDLIAMFREETGHQIAYFTVVVDDEETGSFAHGLFPVKAKRCLVF